MNGPRPQKLQNLGSSVIFWLAEGVRDGVQRVCGSTSWLGELEPEVGRVGLESGAMEDHEDREGLWEIARIEKSS